ncbi:UNVERIFIED_CONTAM: Ppp4r4 [Trichonephila clavipes]
MWLSDEETNFEDDCIKEQGNEKMRFRSNSPPFEGGESLCEFILDPYNDVFHYVGEGKLPCRNFLSLLNQDLLPTSTFTQTFLQSILSSVDSTDPVVANAWMETLLDVIDLLPKEIVKGEILTLAVNKGQMSQPVSSRLLCCKMLGKICLKFDAYVIMACNPPYCLYLACNFVSIFVFHELNLLNISFSPLRIKKEVLPVVLSLCQDVDFEVRGYMCRQLDIVAKGIGLEATKSAILPELVELANDEETFVRLAAIETVVQMLPLLDDDTCTQAIIPLVKKLCENSFSSKDSTLPVVSKQLGQLCCGLANIFSVEQKQWFLKFFQELSKLGLPNTTKNRSPFCSPLPDLLPEVDHKDRFRECRHACAYNFPAMVLFIGSENFEKELYATFKDLCSDPFLSVRQTVACGFYEVLKGIIPYLPECLKIICCCTQDSDKSSLVKALIACEEATSVTSSWRLHADFLSCLSCLPSCISSEIIFTTFVPLLFVKLHTARPIPCRTAAAYSLLIFLRNTPSLERRKGIINELIRELCYGRSCHKRMLFIRVCELVIELFSKVFFKLHFFKPLLTLSGFITLLWYCTSTMSFLWTVDSNVTSFYLSTFTSFIRPVIDYGSELLVTASDSALSKLDIVQNKTLRFITGAATLTPIAAMQLQTEISGPSERRQYSAFALADPVPNIRLRLCAVLPRLKGLIKLPKDSHLLQQLESCIKALISDEKDRDVSYAVSRAIEELDKIEVATETISRRSSCIEIALDMKDRLKEEEERRQLEMEFNSKLLEESKNLHALSLSPNVAKSGKIPIRKSGTLPKQSKVKSAQPEQVEKVSSSQSKSLRILKKERRISSPAVIVEFQKNSSQILQTTRDVSTSTTDTVKITSSPKCNIPKSRSQSPNVRTWPRQKRSSSLIPKQSVNRCPSPMPQQRRFSEQINKEISSPEIVKKTLKVIRRSTTLNNLSSDSKIPSFSKKSVLKES